MDVRVDSLNSIEIENCVLIFEAKVLLEVLFVKSYSYFFVSEALKELTQRVFDTAR